LSRPLRRAMDKVLDNEGGLRGELRQQKRVSKNREG
jgi:hypothetical protein